MLCNNFEVHYFYIYHCTVENQTFRKFAKT